MAKRKSVSPATPGAVVKNYQHSEAKSLMRPDVGTQAQFRKKKGPQTYRYDSSLSPAMEWDGQTPAREQGEALLHMAIAAMEEAIRQAPDSAAKLTKPLQEAREALEKLKALSKPFLNWAGKAERLSFEVPTLPLFVHERLSTRAILETLKSHRKCQAEQLTLFELFADPQHPVSDQVLRAYEHKDNWTNRMILGDSLVAMNSLLRYESLGGQVQMIYMDPPYGVKFGSNFQPFVRKRDVGHNDDADMTREPEMVQAYRDTWELGLHSYLTYLRDRLLLSRDLLAPSGSIFVQISDENVHHVREVMDEVFGAENYVGLIFFQKTSYATAEHIPAVGDYLIWYGRNKERVKVRKLFFSSIPVGEDLASCYLELSDKTIRKVSSEEVENPLLMPPHSKIFHSRDLASAGAGSSTFEFKFNGKNFHPGANRHWKTSREGLEKLVREGRLLTTENSLRYKRYITDYPWTELTNVWSDTIVGSFHEARLYVVQTSPKVIQRCLLMTTDPGDLVLDPTCGSGTTAYVAEQWGRRWITMDTSRVPLALARQRLLTATFPFYELQDDGRGPASGFVYKRRQNQKGEEVGGIVPHITLKSIANNEPAQEEVLVDRPEQVKGVTRVTGPFAFEATIPTPVDWEGDGAEDSQARSSEEYGNFIERMLEVLRRSPLLRLEKNRSVQLHNIRPPAKALTLSAEAMVDSTAHGQKTTLADLVDEAEAKNGGLALNRKPVSLVFGPENGAVSEKLVYEAAREAHMKSYTHLYVIGFAIQPNARKLVDECEQAVGVPATYVQATPDLMMGDLLKNMRSSQIFSVCGLPEVELKRLPVDYGSKDAGKYQVKLLGLDLFDPATMETEHRGGNDVPAWFLDTDYNGLCFHVCQAFFPRTSAWENLKKALKAEYAESVWDHLAGAVSAPFAGGTHGQIAVKVIDDRGNELMVVKSLKEAVE